MIVIYLSIISASFMKEPKKQSLKKSATIIIVVVVIPVIIVIILSHLLVLKTPGSWSGHCKAPLGN